MKRCIFIFFLAVTAFATTSCTEPTVDNTPMHVGVDVTLTNAIKCTKGCGFGPCAPANDFPVTIVTTVYSISSPSGGSTGTRTQYGSSTRVTANSLADNYMELDVPTSGYYVVESTVTTDNCSFCATDCNQNGKFLGGIIRWTGVSLSTKGTQHITIDPDAMELIL